MIALNKQQLQELIRSNFDTKFAEHQSDIIAIAKNYSESKTPSPAHYMRAYEEVTLTIVEESLYNILSVALNVDDE